MDRSIDIALQRRGQGERIEKLRGADPLEFDRLRRQAFRWALDNGEQVQKIRPRVPEILNDRAGDNWFPLLGIATVAGGDWYKTAANAALALSANESDDNIQILLLAEVQRIFREKGEEILTTGEIISDLNENEEAPWADWDKGMTAKKLGGILKGFGVKSGRHRKDGDQKRGYALEELRPVFDRYLTTPPPESGPQSVSPTANQVPEPLSAVTDSKIDPSQRHIENSIRHTAEIVARRDAEAANQGTLAKLRREASITHPDCVLTESFRCRRTETPPLVYVLAFVIVVAMGPCLRSRSPTSPQPLVAYEIPASPRPYQPVSLLPEPKVPRAEPADRRVTVCRATLVALPSKPMRLLDAP